MTKNIMTWFKNRLNKNSDILDWFENSDNDIQIRRYNKTNKSVAVGIDSNGDSFVSTSSNDIEALRTLKSMMDGTYFV